MNRQQAFALLQQRIRARSPLAPAPLAPVKCLFCNDQAHFRERATTNLFCGSQCQQLIYALGMKRERDDEEEIVVTNDVLQIIFTMAYREALYSVEEYEELMSLRLVDKQFTYVIDSVVIPRIRFLCGAILHRITEESLLKFTRLEEFVKENVVLGKNIKISTVCQLKWLRKLTLDSIQISPEIDFSTLENLEKLTLDHMRRWYRISNQQVNSMKNLSSITIIDCEGLSVDCFNGLIKLEKIKLYNGARSGMVHFRPLNSLKQLKSLVIDDTIKMHDEDINQLTGLTSISLPGDGRIRQITLACLSNFPLLTKLDISDNDAFVNLSRIDLPLLEKLDISDIEDVELDQISHFHALKSLVMENCSIRFATADALVTNFPQLTQISLHGTSTEIYGAGKQLYVLPETVTTLSVWQATSRILTYTKTNITALFLDRCVEFGDDDLAKHPQLEVLFINERCEITNDGLSKMTNLKELCIVGNANYTMDTLIALNLQYLYLKYTLIKPEAIAEIRKRGVIVFEEYVSFDGIDKLPPRAKQWL